MKQIRFTQNVLDQETQISYVVGQPVELPVHQANRLLAAGVAISVDEEELKEKNVDELKQIADELHVDLTGQKQSKDAIAKKIAKEA